MKPFIFLKTFRPITLICSFVLILGLILTSVFLFSVPKNTKNLTAKDVLKDKVIAIDPGHGGEDPGAIGVTGALEKDLNLALSLKLKERLESHGAKVIITRTKDKDFGGTKKDDLNARAEKVEKSKADIFIGMQCNAIPDASCHGAQVFFYPDSTKGEALAKEIQSALWVTTEQSHKREAQTISSPYILYTVSIPAVIVEAGFLSNAEEEALLLKEDYQEKVALAVEKGIVNYYKTTPVFYLLSF